MKQKKEIEDEIELKDNIDIEGIDIYKHIQSLNEKLRTVIILRFFEDMRIEEIALGKTDFFKRQ